MIQRHAWKTVALALYIPEAERDVGEYAGLIGVGLCGAIQRSGVNLTAQAEMLATIDHEVRLSGWSPWICAPSPANDVLRADFCWLQYVRLGGR